MEKRKYISENKKVTMEKGRHQVENKKSKDIRE